MQLCISTYPLTLIRAFQDMLRNLEIVNAQFNRTLNISMTSSKNIHRNMTSVWLSVRRKKISVYIYIESCNLHTYYALYILESQSQTYILCIHMIVKHMYMIIQHMNSIIQHMDSIIQHIDHIIQHMDSII